MTAPQRLLNDEIRDQIRERFQELAGEVVVKLFTQSETASVLMPGKECPGCAPTQRLLEELAELSDKIRLEVVDVHTDQAETRERGVERIPCTLVGDGEWFPFRYYGLPSGYEFATLLEVIVRESRGGSGLSERNRELVQAIDKDVSIQVFVTPT